MKLSQFLDNDYDEIDDRHKNYINSHSIAKKLQQNLKRKSKKKEIEKLNKFSK